MSGIGTTMCQNDGSTRHRKEQCSKRLDPYSTYSSCSLDPTQTSLGIERRRSEMRQLGGLLLALGIGAAHSSLALTAILVDGMAGRRQFAGFRLPVLTATIIQSGLGMTSMAVGFYTMLFSPISRRAHLFAKVLVGVVNLGPISFIISVIRLIQGAREQPEDNEFIPHEMGPTSDDMAFVVGMGILSLVSVCGTLIGGLTVVGLNLCAYLGGQPVDKHRGYYLIRFGYYNILTFLGGMSQAGLGVYLGNRFGWGPYRNAVHVAVYTIFFPGIAVVVGAVQTLYSLYGWSRAMGWIDMSRKNDQSFMIATLACWLVTMILQIIVQPSYGDGAQFDAEGATYAAVYLGFFIMPAWLDWLARVTPSRVHPLRYSLPEETTCKEDFLCKMFGLTEGTCALKHEHEDTPVNNQHESSKQEQDVLSCSDV